MVNASWLNTEDDSDLTELSSEEEPESHTEVLPVVAPPPSSVAQARSHPHAVTPSTCGPNRKLTRPSTQEATQKSKARITDKFPKPALGLGRLSPMTAWALYELIKQGQIELNPEYQRGVVWSESKQSSFINSLYHRFHAPQILFNVEVDDDGTIRRTCIDGKQRLTSICQFFDGKISLKPFMNSPEFLGNANRKYWFIKDANFRNRALLPPQIMANLKTTQISCVEYDNLGPEHEREMFQRVQYGVPLGPADRFPAINGPWADLVREIRNRINTTQGFEGYLDWGKARGKDFQALAQFVYLVIHGAMTRKAEPTTSRLETFLNSSDGKPSAFREVTFNTMDIFCRIAQTPIVGEPLTVELSPLEFVMASYLIYLQRTRLTDAQLSDAISRMRKNAKRGCSQDLKFNTANFKHILGFLQKEVPKLISLGKLMDDMDIVEERVASNVPYDRVEGEDRFRYNMNIVGDNETGHRTSVGNRRRRINDETEDVGPKSKRAKVSTKKSDSQDTTLEKDVPSFSAPVSKPVSKPEKSVAKTKVKKSLQKTTARSSFAAASGNEGQRLDRQVARPSVRPSSSMAIRTPPSRPVSSSPSSTQTASHFGSSFGQLVPSKCQLPSRYAASQNPQTKSSEMVSSPIPMQASKKSGPTSFASAVPAANSSSSPSQQHNDRDREGSTGGKYALLKFSKDPPIQRRAAYIDLTPVQNQSRMTRCDTDPDHEWQKGFGNRVAPQSGSANGIKKTYSSDAYSAVFQP